MKRPLAYITAAWCGDPDTDMELAARYCRMAYEAGFSPICPILYLPLFINDAIPEEHKNGIDMRRDMLRRSHVLVVCGGEVDEDVKNDIAVAIESQQSTPSLSQAQRMRELDQKGVLNGDVIDGIMMEDKKEVDKVILTGAELSKYFGKETTPREMKDQIIKLLDDWKSQQKEVAKPEKKSPEAEK